MYLKKNVGPADRVARIIGGAAAAAVARQPLFKVLGAFWVLEGITGYCLWYDVMNINTLPEGKKREEENEELKDFPMPEDVLRFRSRAMQ
ncbi:YgaP family membrane protein [Desulfotomaculum copahuensis]|uniref:Inner membrane protein YgaP-like transmembrane domain-containing protein n=1 Tax=Desulfotomaculum copahuensis TaxID=1838280 RepID=A0A1B7LFV3_9FIRM|nr:DUF2892 domain-containing protein [Desulfotomaculum copahuensis]OAT83589.1 hypothetical protein A6M21_07845 [Desulfotomaculum copahuensis]